MSRRRRSRSLPAVLGRLPLAGSTSQGVRADTHERPHNPDYILLTSKPRVPSKGALADAKLGNQAAQASPSPYLSMVPQLSSSPSLSEPRRLHRRACSSDLFLFTDERERVIQRARTMSAENRDPTLRSFTPDSFSSSSANGSIYFRWDPSVAVRPQPLPEETRFASTNAPHRDLSTSHDVVGNHRTAVEWPRLSPPSFSQPLDNPAQLSSRLEPAEHFGGAADSQALLNVVDKARTTMGLLELNLDTSSFSVSDIRTVFPEDILLRLVFGFKSRNAPPMPNMSNLLSLDARVRSGSATGSAFCDALFERCRKNSGESNTSSDSFQSFFCASDSKSSPKRRVVRFSHMVKDNAAAGIAFQLWKSQMQLVLENSEGMPTVKLLCLHSYSRQILTDFASLSPFPSSNIFNYARMVDGE
jgi:hypothetical protein